MVISKMEITTSLVDAGRLVVDGVDDLEFEGFGIVLVCHIAGDDALE